MNPYEVLGVPRDADQNDIKAAFRRMSRKHHPDKGGDPAEMAKVNVAYEMLSDPKRRARYDATGNFERVVDIETLSQAYLMQAISDSLDKIPENINLVTFLREAIAQQVRLGKQEVASKRAKLEGLEKRRAKFVRKSGGDNLFSQVIDQKLVGLRAGLEQDDNTIMAAERALEILVDYKFDGSSDPMALQRMLFSRAVMGGTTL